MEFFAKRFNELTVTQLYEILKSRAEIFLLEQNIICQDLDNRDYDSLHCFFNDDKRVVAYLRAFYSEKDVVTIGRVLTLSHGNGIGRDLMNNSIEKIKTCLPCKKITVHAQKQAIGFYEKMGFVIVSDEFVEEGVIHVTMEYDL